MYCSLCQKYDQQPYNRDIWNKQPCSRLRLQSIKRHESNAAHSQSLLRERDASKVWTLRSIFSPPLPAKGMEQAFSCLYFLTKQRIAHTTNYEPLLDLMSYLGVKIKEKIGKGMNATYTSEKTIQEMVFVMSESLEKKMLESMRESSHFSILFNETTDCTVTEQLAVHRCFITNSGELRCCFLKIIDLLHLESAGIGSVNANAETITNRVRKFMGEAELDLSKLRGIETDGASTMIGCRNGVVMRLKNLTPSAISVHCAAHRLNLASSHASVSVPYVRKFPTILRQLFDYFNNSAVRTAGLEAVQALINESGKLIAPCTTRWLSVDRSVNCLKSCFTSVVISLQRESQERSDVRALGLVSMTCEFRFIATMLLLCDTLPHVSHLSKCFQIQDCDYSIIPKMLSSMIACLEHLKSSDGTNLAVLESFLAKLSEAGINTSNPSNLGEEYFKSSIKEPYLSALIENLNGRFDDKAEIASFSVFNPEKLQRSGNAMEYGVQEIETLARHYQGLEIIGSIEECVDEWKSYRQFLKGNCSEMKFSEVIIHLCTNSTTSTIFPNMSTLAKIGRVIPIYTADVEWTFSQLKLIKTPIRNRMQEQTLDSLRRIAIEGPPLNSFPVAEAVALWASKKQRGLYH